MKTKILKMVAGGFMLLSLTVNAQQLATEKLKEFPSGVITKVYELASKVQLTEQQQVQFARHFVKEEQMLADAIVQGKSQSELNTIKTSMQQRFLKLLNSKEQLVAYNEGRKIQELSDRVTDSLLIKKGLALPGGKYNTAYDYRKEIRLSRKQVDILLDKMSRIEQIKKDFRAENPKGDFSAYTAQDLQKILTPVQYNKLLQVKYQKKAEKWAQSRWKEMQEYNLHIGKDSALVVKQLINYQNNKLVTVEKLIGDKARQQAAEKTIIKNKPVMLKELDKAKVTVNKTGEDMVKRSFVW